MEDIYSGRVKTVANSRLTIELTHSQSACGGCAVASLCHGTDRCEMLVDAGGCGEVFEVGDEVLLTPDVRSKYRAILYCILLPLALMFLVAVSFYLCHMPQWILALGAVVVPVIYYGLLYLVRHRVESSVKWIVTRL